MHGKDGNDVILLSACACRPEFDKFIGHVKWHCRRDIALLFVSLQVKKAIDRRLGLLGGSARHQLCFDTVYVRKLLKGALGSKRAEVVIPPL